MTKNLVIKVVQFWDGILFKISNFFQHIIFFLKILSLRSFLRKNINLKDLHKGEECFILMNGPSLLNHDLTRLKDKQVFCVNHFWSSDLFTVVKPNYYLASDTSFFAKENLTEDNYIEKIVRMTQKDNAKCIFPHRFIEATDRKSVPENVYLTYSKHKPTSSKIRSDLSSLSSVFSTVSLYAINAAIGMGFSKIYLLGYDLPPWKGGLMPHAHENTDHEKKTEARLVGDEDTFTQTSLHWMYYQAQLENYYMASHARKIGVDIFNCSEESFVRAFKYINFNDIPSFNE